MQIIINPGFGVTLFPTITITNEPTLLTTAKPTQGAVKNVSTSGISNGTFIGIAVGIALFLIILLILIILYYYNCLPFQKKMSIIYENDDDPDDLVIEDDTTLEMAGLPKTFSPRTSNDPFIPTNATSIIASNSMLDSSQTNTTVKPRIKSTLNMSLDETAPFHRRTDMEGEVTDFKLLTHNDDDNFVPLSGIVRVAYFI
jgi:hypothetical protein